MKRLVIFYLFAFPFIFGGCSATLEEFNFSCKLNNEEFSANEIPIAVSTDSKLTISANQGVSRFQVILWPGAEGTYISGGSNFNALIQFWEDENNYPAQWTSSGSVPNGTVTIARVTSSIVHGSFHGTIYRTGFPEIVVSDGAFICKRP